MKVLSLIIVLFVFQANAQIDLLNNTNVSIGYRHRLIISQLFLKLYQTFYI